MSENNKELFRIGIVVDEFMDTWFKNNFNIGKACNTKSKLNDLFEYIIKETKRFLKEIEWKKTKINRC